MARFCEEASQRVPYGNGAGCDAATDDHDREIAFAALSVCAVDEFAVAFIPGVAGVASVAIASGAHWRQADCDPPCKKLRADYGSSRTGLSEKAGFHSPSSSTRMSIGPA